MKYIFRFFFLLCFKSTIACECRTKPAIDISDLNESELIFTATLTHFEVSDKATTLTFSTSDVLKGKLTKTISYRVEGDQDHHNGLHYVDTMFIGQKWIVFSSHSKSSTEFIYQLTKSNSTDYCMLSKPIVANDPYLEVVYKLLKNPGGKNITYSKENVAFATGRLKNKIPTGVWKYYTRNDLMHYWEGIYTKGKRNGKWVEKAMNYKNEQVIINEALYDIGVLKERVEYDYNRVKKLHEVYGDTFEKRIIYHLNTISSIMIYDKTLNTTTIENFTDGKSTITKIQQGRIF